MALGNVRWCVMVCWFAGKGLTRRAAWRPMPGMPPEWKGPEEWMPLLDRLVAAGVLLRWHGSAEAGIRLVWNPEFGDGFGGERALQGLALILAELDPPVTIRDLREIAGFAPPWQPPDRR